MLPHWLDSALIAAVDGLQALVPRRQPGARALAAARIISHRGQRDNRGVLENSLPAFDALRGSGVWGLEFDVRWTADLQPVVFHDADLRRLAGDHRRIADFQAAALCREFSFITPLAELVARYAAEFHLLVELKPEAYPQPQLQAQALEAALAPAAAQQGCHYLCLDTDLLDALPGIAPAQTLAVGRFNVSQIGSEALTRGRAGIGGHYALMPDALVRRQRSAGQHVASGYPASAAVLRRELNRGVDWIVSNDALRMQRVLQRLKEASEDRR